MNPVLDWRDHPITRRVIGILAIVAILAGIGVVYYRTHRTGVHFKADFTGAVGVYPGSDVRILGVPVGKVDSVKPAGPYVVVSMHLDPNVNATATTKAVIVSPDLVSDRYVQLTGAYVSGPKLAGGTLIPASRTATPVELDQLYNSLISLTHALGPAGANKNGALSDLLETAKNNFTGNTGAFRRTLHQFSLATSTLAQSRKGIYGTLDHLSAFTKTLKENNSSVETVNQQLASFTHLFVQDRQSFGEALHELGIALGQVQTFVASNRSAITTNVDRLSQVAGDLENERTSLEQTLHATPLLVKNFIKAYDAKHNLIRGRADLNELTIYAKAAARAARFTPRSSSSTTSSTPPSLLPSAGDQ